MAYHVRTRNCYDPQSAEPFKLSRSRLEVFLSCPRCFYMDRRLGVDRVQGPAFTLNSATDTLLKKEFDAYRTAATPHPLFERFGVEAIPYSHPDLNTWRENFQGIQFLHAASNLLLTGAIDDVWQLRDGTLAIVDYKSTSTVKEIRLDDPWKQAYKRQMEIYQWLFRNNGFNVSNTGYFLFVNADTARGSFDGTLVFKSQILPYTGNDSWVEAAVVGAHACLCADALPDASPECDWCAYRIASSPKPA
jgi:RecB family exonuclease